MVTVRLMIEYMWLIKDKMKKTDCVVVQLYDGPMGGGSDSKPSFGF
jgi:hypothetical protein